VQVSDCGKGIAGEDPERLSTPFVRGSNTRELPGFGLGLSVAREALALIGGDMNFTDRSEGGVTVSLCIPLQ